MVRISFDHSPVKTRERLTRKSVYSHQGFNPDAQTISPHVLSRTGHGHTVMQDAAAAVAADNDEEGMCMNLVFDAKGLPFLTCRKANTSTATVNQTDFHIERWMNLSGFPDHHDRNEERCEVNAQVEVNQRQATFFAPTETNISRVPTNDSDQDRTAGANASVPYPQGRQPGTTMRKQTAYFPQGRQFSTESVVGPHLLTPTLRHIADERYSDEWIRTLNKQIDMLTCCMLATPDPRTAALKSCRIGATNLWKQLYYQKVQQIQGLHHDMSFKIHNGPIRNHLLQTLATIHRTQCRPRSNSNNNNDASNENGNDVNDADMERYRIRFHLELLRWEADEMCDLSRTCDHYRTRRIQQSGISCRIVDGFYFDLINMINFPLPATYD